MEENALPTAVKLAGPFTYKTRYEDHLFAPYDDTMAPLLAIIAGAKKSLHFIAFDVTLRALADRVEQLVDMKGTDVRGVADLSQSTNLYEVPAITRLKAAMGANLAIGVSPVGHQIIHTKLVIADHKIAWYGSANLTTAGAHEHNIVIVQRHKKVVAAIEAAFQQVYLDTLAHPS